MHESLTDRELKFLSEFEKKLTSELNFFKFSKVSKLFNEFAKNLVGFVVLEEFHKKFSLLSRETVEKLIKTSTVSLKI